MKAAIKAILRVFRCCSSLNVSGWGQSRPVQVSAPGSRRLALLLAVRLQNAPRLCRIANGARYLDNYKALSPEGKPEFATVLRWCGSWVCGQAPPRRPPGFDVVRFARREALRFPGLRASLTHFLDRFYSSDLDGGFLSTIYSASPSSIPFLATR